MRIRRRKKAQLPKSPTTTISKRFFTLLEIMVGITLIVMASGLVGWKMHQAVVKKRFQSGLDRLMARCIFCQRLAVSMEEDWQGILKSNGKGWVFETRCQNNKGFPSLILDSCSLSFNGKKADGILIDFFSTGQVHPEGILIFSLKDTKLKQEWSLPEIFKREEGLNQKKVGPVHPDEI